MQRLNHHHLYLFWIFGKTGSFTKTAEELKIAQSAVTSQLKQLEDSLSVNLIDRSNPRRLSITPAGRKVIEYAEKIFESSRELINWATNGAVPKKQTIRIGAISGLSRNLQFEFIKPLIGNVEVKFEITTGEQKSLIDALMSHELDVVLTSQGVSEYGRGELFSNVLLSSPVVLVSSLKHSKTSSRLEKNNKIQNLYIPGKNFDARPELEAYLDEMASRFRIAGEIDDVALLRILALRTKAVVAIPQMGVKNDLENGDLFIVSSVKGVSQRFYAITRHKLNPSDQIKMLINTLKAEA